MLRDVHIHLERGPYTRDWLIPMASYPLEETYEKLAGKLKKQGMYAE